jgi:DNA-binding transcriptional MocR family regulator
MKHLVVSRLMDTILGSNQDENITTMTIWTPTLDRSKPLYLAIADAISKDVDGGTLTRGDRLPPQRDLAWKLGVTLGTVTRAYKEAEQRGLLSGEVGRGSYIRQSQSVSAIPATSAELDDLVDLTQAIPPPVVTTQEFDSALHSIMRDSRRLDLLDYAPQDGFPQHIAMAAKWLKRSGIEANEREIFITAGAHIGLVTVLEALTESRDIIMAETINYALLSKTFKNIKLDSMALDMDHDGLLPEAFEQAAQSGKSRILYLVPTLQNPTTGTMTHQRREAIVAIAQKYNITILEDDIFRLLDARVQPPTFYSLAPELTYHISGLSKTLAPGLRIGYVLTPKGQDRILRSYIRSMPARTVGLTGEIARYWIESDMAQGILNRTRDELTSRRASFIEVFKGYNFRCEPGAPFAWLELPEHWAAARFASALLANRIKVSPGSIFQLNPRNQSRHIRVCFGNPQSTWKIRQAFETIRTLMNNHDEDDFTPVA